MKILFGKCLLLISLLFFIQPTADGMGGKLSKPTVAIQKTLTAAAFGLVLAGSTLLPSVVQAQEAAEEVVESPWTIVDESTPQFDYLHNVFNLHVTKVDEPETQFLFPVGYLGKSALGEEIFIAYEKPGWISLLEETAAGVDLSLINYRGEVWQDVSITHHAIAEDKLDGFLNVAILSIAGAEIDLPSPLQLASYPYDDGGAFVRLASYQRLAYRPSMTEEEIELGAASFRLGTRNDCRVVNSPKWASVGVGLHTCRGPGSEGFTGGAMVFRQHKLAAIQNAAVNTFAVVRGISPNIVETARGDAGW